MLGLFFPLKAAKVELGLTAASSDRYYGTKFSRSLNGVHLGPFFFGLAYADLGWLIVSYRAAKTRPSDKGSKPTHVYVIAFSKSGSTPVLVHSNIIVLGW